MKAINYLANFENAQKLCDKFEQRVETVFFRGGESKESNIPDLSLAEFYRELLSPIKACIQMCQILKLSSLRDYESFFYEEASSLEDTTKIKNLEDFKSHLKTIKLAFTMAAGEMQAFCSSFDEEEKERINEAINTYLLDCNYSCVAMSVSAVESRLLKLMCIANPDSKDKLEKKTLGQLIYEYISNKKDYKNVVPERHEPLLDLCNTYRTFSVHPKKQKIRPPIASSILNLAIEFLIDQDTKPEVVKAQLLASGEDE